MKVRQIRVGENRVGLVGLEEAFEAIRELSLPEEALRKELLKRVKEKNYIPEQAESLFEEALWREYRRYLGEEVQEDYGGKLVVQVLGVSCPRCDALEREVRSALAELEIEAVVEHVSDPREIARFGPVPTPTLVINGRIVSRGKVLNRKELVGLFRKFTSWE